MFAGKVSTFAGKRQLAHPEFKLLGADDADKAAEFAGELIPVYPATRDLPSWEIERCVRVVLDTLGEVDDPLPEAVRERHGLVGLATALLRHPPPGRPGRSGPRPEPAQVGRGLRCCRPCWPSAAGPPRPCRPPPARPGRAACWTRSTRGCRSV